MSMNVTDEGIKDAMTLDQLLEELQSAKASGLMKGDEKITFGLGFLSGSLTVKSMVVGTTIDGTMAVALTPESELEWANHAKEEGSNIGFHDRTKPELIDALELAKNHGFSTRVAELESEALNNAVPSVAPASKAPKAL